MLRSKSVAVPEVNVGVAVLSTAERKGSPLYCTGAVREAIQSAMREAGLGHHDSACPLTDIIVPGATVLLKPSWVLHRHQSGKTMDCMVTHPAFIEVVLDEVLATKPGRVIIGDAPIQSCQFDVVAPPQWIARLKAKTEARVEFMDFRRHRVMRSDLADGVLENARSEDRYVLFDLGQDSLLDPISDKKPRFRVTDYDPRVLAQTHRRGKHQYLLCKEAFEADVIINLPKLKTHRKTGITGALKNLVGLNGNKDYLPHHRLGGTALGGDCYPGYAPLKRMAEFCLDQANRRVNTRGYRKWHERAYRVLGWHRRLGEEEIEGGWYGNDTIWRMVLDLNRILAYGRVDGTLADTRQRRIYTITDAIIAGQGEGPLSPEPLALGLVTFATSSTFADLVHAGLLGMDYQRIPLVRDAFGRFRYPLTDCGPEECIVRANGVEMSWNQAAQRFGKPARPPRGWSGHVELAVRHSHEGKAAFINKDSMSSRELV